MKKEEYIQLLADLKAKHEIELTELNNLYCMDKSPIKIGDIIESWNGIKIIVKSFKGGVRMPEADCHYRYKGNIIDVKGNQTDDETSIFTTQLLQPKK